MDLRKIQRTGGGTYLVSLPKNWAERNGLGRGSLVAISEIADGRLTVDPQYNVEKSPKIVLIEPTPHLEREIIGKYLLGYDVIKIVAKNRMSLTDRGRIKKSSSRLIGLEIIEEDHSKIVMQCLLEPSAFPPEKILRREYSIASSMHRDAVTAFLEKDDHLAKNVISRDEEVDRLYFLLVRILRTVIQNPHLSEKLNILPIDCLDYRLAASLVELIGDQSTQIAEIVTKLEGLISTERLSQQFIHLHQVVYESHEKALRVLFEPNLSLIESITSKQETVLNVIGEIENIVNDNSVKFAPHVLAVASSIQRIFNHSIDIADLGMPKPV